MQCNIMHKRSSSEIFVSYFESHKALQCVAVAAAEPGWMILTNYYSIINYSLY